MFHTILIVLLVLFAAVPALAGATRPDIIVIMFDDFSQRMAAYGDTAVRTPNLDAFAKDSIRFAKAYTAAPVCAPSRAALFSGMHQQAIGAQHMRTRGAAGLPSGGPIPYDAVPPRAVKWFPELLRREGYFTMNVGKTDYQIGDPFTIWDVNAPDLDWRKFPTGKPLFAFINLFRTHESFLWPIDLVSESPLVKQVVARNRRMLGEGPGQADPAMMRVPAYLPDTPVVRADIARLYDNVARDDAAVGEIIRQLKADGRYDTSIIIITGDHGDGLPRMKRAVQASGLHVPLLVRLPGGRRAGTVVEKPISFVDLAPTILALAAAPVPGWMQGRAWLGPAGDPSPRAVLAGSDRFDEVPEWQRTLIDGDWQYIRNHRPDVALLRPLAFRDVLPTMQEIWRLDREGHLPPAVRQWLDAPRAEEELYDLRADPDTVRNLAADPVHARRLRLMRGQLQQRERVVGDLSRLPEREMIAQMWPGLKQPVTAAPAIRLSVGGDDMQVRISSATPGASIGYRLGDGDPWQLYVRPFSAPAGSRIAARAIRYGYAPSAIAVAGPQEIEAP